MYNNYNNTKKKKYETHKCRIKRIFMQSNRRQVAEEEELEVKFN